MMSFDHAVQEIFENWKAKQKRLAFPKPEQMQPTYKCYVIDGCVIEEAMMENYFHLRNMNFHHSDIIVSSFPKSGTAWVQELVYLIKTLDFKEALNTNLDERSIYLEWPAVTIPEHGDPRFFKTHLPPNLLLKYILDKKCKVVYVHRNPKDIIVSSYHFYKMMKPISYKGTFKDFFQLFINDFTIYAPYTRYVKEYWNHRNDDNLLYLTYEGLQKDNYKCIREIAKFLGKSLTEEQVKDISKHCNFNQMAKNPTTNYSQWDQLGITVDNGIKYMRKGKVGDWRNYFDNDMEHDFQDWIRKNFSDSDIKFEYT